MSVDGASLEKIISKVNTHVKDRILFLKEK